MKKQSRNNINSIGNNNSSITNIAGVVLATLTGQGNIIGNAENAVEKYNNKVEEEQIVINAIDKYLNELPKVILVNEETETINKGDIINVSTYFRVEGSGNITIKYINLNDNTEIIDTSKLDMGTYTIRCISTKNSVHSSYADKIINVAVPLADVVDLGDYVEYDEGDKTVTILTSESGLNSPDQTFYTNEYNKGWQVLQNQNNIINLISADTVNDLMIYGLSGWQNFVAAINKLSAGYVNEDYATQGKSIGNALGSFEDDINYMKQAGVNNIGKNYYLASNYYVSDGDGYYYYYIRIIEEDGENRYYTAGNTASLSNLPYASWQNRSWIITNAVRPVITLKEGIRTIGGNGEKDSPWLLVK